MKGVLLHLLRHGAPERPGLLLGRTDDAPTISGIDHCRRQATGLDVVAIVSSDLARAQRAAAGIGADRGLPVRIDSRWRELDFGDWDGRAASEIEAKALAAFWSDPDGHPPPGGERWSALKDRVASALDAWEGQETLVVTHGGAMRAALAHLCGFTLPQLWAFDLPYSALLSLRVWPGSQPSGQVVGLRP